MTKIDVLPAQNVVRPLPLTVDNFLLLDANGSFDGYGKTELIRGGIQFMNAQHSRHGRIKMRLATGLIEGLRSLGSSLEVLSEVSVRADPDSAPMPDILVTTYSGDALVPVDTIRLVVEVADTTLDFDLGAKALLYAQNGIPEYWVVDVVNRSVIQLTEPSADGYRSRSLIALGKPVVSQGIAELTIDTTNLV